MQTLMCYPVRGLNRGSASKRQTHCKFFFPRVTPKREIAPPKNHGSTKTKRTPYAFGRFRLPYPDPLLIIYLRDREEHLPQQVLLVDPSFRDKFVLEALHIPFCPQVCLHGTDRERLSHTHTHTFFSGSGGTHWGGAQYGGMICQAHGASFCVS